MLGALTVFIVILVLAICAFDTYAIYSSARAYEQIDNDNDIAAARRFLKCSGKRNTLHPLDNYRIGSVYDRILHDPARAHAHYMAAIYQVQDEPDDATFIHGRLRDRVVAEIAHTVEIDEARYQLHNLAELTAELKDLEQALSSTRPKTIENQVKWVLDTQNVHDSNINNELKKGFDDITRDTAGMYVWSIPEIREYILNVYTKEAAAAERANIEPALEMLAYIDKHGRATVLKLGVSEKVFVGRVFTKILAAPHPKTLLENLILNLKECHSGGHPVCITGRVTRIMSSFAGADATNPSLGILRSKPVLRNEILTRGGALRNKLFEAAPKELRQRYTDGKRDQDVLCLEDSIKKAITDMVYRDYQSLAEEDNSYVKIVYC